MNKFIKSPTPSTNQLAPTKSPQHHSHHIKHLSPRTKSNSHTISNAENVINLDVHTHTISHCTPHQEHQVYKCYQSGCSHTHNIPLYPPYQEHQVYQCYQSGCSHTHMISHCSPTRNTRSISAISLDVHTHT